MTHPLSSWTARGVQEMYTHGSYALAALSPGGSITAALGGAIIAGLVSLLARPKVAPRRGR
jgi:hypothetical protein